ncbi:MAG: iron-only hydrogenase system regulator [Clostridia bacterium]|nr:iron-only hydrogenase system regulator [Clostridia bacterium]MBR5387973.1 iron-only hydrogenase system regulator [Clostridia bacterium]
MENKIAVITIIVNDISAVDTVNSLLHEYRDYVIGRMGIPYKPKEVNIISVVLDASQEKINGLSGKLGMINGVTSKVLTAK